MQAASSAREVSSGVPASGPRRARWGFIASVVLWVAPLVYLAYSLCIVLLIRRTAYDGLKEFYSARWPEAWDADSFFKTCFTPDWYRWVQGHGPMVIAGIVATGVGYLFFTRRLLRFFEAFWNEVGRGAAFLAGSFTGCSRGEKRLVLGLFGVLVIYWVILFFQAPMFLDETNDYLHFARQGFFFTIMNYPVPNNHIFLSVVCSWLYKIPFLSPAMVMRLPSMVAAFAIYYIVFAVFRRFSDFGRAMIVVAGVAFVHLLSYYTVQGRGYLLQLFFILVNALSGWMYFFPWPGARGGHLNGGISAGVYGRFGYPLFIVSAILGFYVNPLFIYHFLAVLAIFGWLILRGRDVVRFRRLAGAVLAIGGVCLVLYLPVMLASGAGSVMDNSSVSREPLSFLKKTWGIFAGGLKYDFYCSTASLAIVPLAIVAAIFCYYRRMIRGFFYDFAFYYLAASIAALVLMTVSKGRFPLERSLCFWVFALNIMFVNVCYDLVRSGFGRRALAVMIVFVTLKSMLSARWLFFQRFSIRQSIDWKFAHEPAALYPELVALHPASFQVMNSEDTYPTFLRLYLLNHRVKTPVLFNTHAAVGDVILVSNTDENHIPLEGYTLWTDRERSAAFGLSGLYSIYVSKGLVH